MSRKSNTIFLTVEIIKVIFFDPQLFFITALIFLCCRVLFCGILACSMLKESINLVMYVWGWLLY